MMKLKLKLSDKQGNGMIIAMGMVLMVAILFYVLLVFGESSAQVSHVKRISQNILDTYTVKAGQADVQSIKSGHDYAFMINERIFTEDFQKALNLATLSKAYNKDHQLVFQLKDVKLTFITNQTLKTEVSYVLTYQYYFLSLPLFTKDITIRQESRYNVK